MKTAALYALLLLAAGGCQVFKPGPVTDQRRPEHSQGTAVGTSFPGVNQGTQSTTATASTDT